VLDDLARRSVFKRASAGLAALWALPAAARNRHKGKKKKKKKHTKASPPSTAFVLVPGRQVCNACKQHAANKLFASRDAVVRAHEGCDCQVGTLNLPREVWLALFQPPGLPATSAVDRRDPRVGQIL
jgi:hypothetical protein